MVDEMNARVCGGGMMLLEGGYDGYSLQYIITNYVFVRWVGSKRLLLR